MSACAAGSAAAAAVHRVPPPRSHTRGTHPRGRAPMPSLSLSSGHLRRSSKCARKAVALRATPGGGGCWDAAGSSARELVQLAEAGPGVLSCLLHGNYAVASYDVSSNICQAKPVACHVTTRARTLVYCVYTRHPVTWRTMSASPSGQAAADVHPSTLGALGKLLGGRGLHSSTFRLNVNGFLWDRGCIQELFRGCLAGLRAYQGVFTIYMVSETAQVELKSARV
jgi:hypothetical protein